MSDDGLAPGVTLPTRSHYSHHQTWLKAYGIPARYRNATLYEHKWLLLPEAQLWLSKWQEGEILGGGEFSGIGLVILGQDAETEAFAAGLAQDAVRVIKPQLLKSWAPTVDRAIRWPSSIGLLHEMLRYPDRDWDRPVSMDDVTGGTSLLVLQGVSTSYTYEHSTIEKIVRARNQRGYPTFLTCLPDQWRSLPANLQSLLLKTSLVVTLV